MGDSESDPGRKLISTLEKVVAISLSILSIVVEPNLAWSSSEKIAQSINCKNPQTTVEMRRCADQSYEKADQQLNQVYRQLKPKLSPSRQKKLVEAQLAWIEFRDKNCTFEASAAWRK
jgi:uncharacterized protein YecT (DUF1311 family)